MQHRSLEVEVSSVNELAGGAETVDVCSQVSLFVQPVCALRFDNRNGTGILVVDELRSVERLEIAICISQLKRKTEGKIAVALSQDVVSVTDPVKGEALVQEDSTSGGKGDSIEYKVVLS